MPIVKVALPGEVCLVLRRLFLHGDHDVAEGGIGQDSTGGLLIVGGTPGRERVHSAQAVDAELAAIPGPVVEIVDRHLTGRADDEVALVLCLCRVERPDRAGQRGRVDDASDLGRRAGRDAGLVVEDVDAAVAVEDDRLHVGSFELTIDFVPEIGDELDGETLGIGNRRRGTAVRHRGNERV